MGTFAGVKKSPSEKGRLLGTATDIFGICQTPRHFFFHIPAEEPWGGEEDGGRAGPYYEKAWLGTVCRMLRMQNQISRHRVYRRSEGMSLVSQAAGDKNTGSWHS